MFQFHDYVYQIFGRRPIFQTLKRVNVNTPELPALVRLHMNVPGRVVANPPKQNVTATSDAPHKFISMIQPPPQNKTISTH
ncbi:MAG TPA: hypothetical protein VGI63_06570 [Verrucomicrobiae bacterium]